jgi:hypothetical protein
MNAIYLSDSLMCNSSEEVQGLKIILKTKINICPLICGQNSTMEIENGNNSEKEVR